jgi:hypothetical protein
VREWIVNVQAPFPHMTFPHDWVAFDEENGAIVFQAQNQLVEPATDANGEPFQFPNWTRLVYAGNGLFCEEEDIYNPRRDIARVFKAWEKAGGKYVTPPRVPMKYK